MYFVNRIELGQSLAEKVQYFKAQDAIVLCLNENALSTGIGLASSLRAWVYPLLTEPVIIPGDPRIIGLINQEGQMCYNPGLSLYEREDLEMEYAGIIQDASREAFSRLNRQANSLGFLNTEILRGRTIILCADIIRDQLQIAAAFELLKPILTKGVVSVAGNVMTDAADALQVATQKSDFMDVMTSMFDDDHYFEQPESYSIEERRQLAINITRYWV